MSGARSGSITRSTAVKQDCPARTDVKVPRMAHPHETHLRPKIIGARIQRVEDPRLLRGLGSYVDDRQIPRVLHVAFRRSDHCHARIGSIDCSNALAAPGVAA